MPIPIAAGRRYGPIEVACRRLRLELLEDRQVPAVLAGTAWQDLNGDGVRDAGEPARPGATVYLDLNQNGRLDADEPSHVTNAAGEYTFSDLEPGTYHVLEAGRPGWAPTHPMPGPLAPGFLTSADWKSIGPRGGDARAVAAAPGNPNIILAGFNAGRNHGAMYRSTDGGATWAKVPGWADRSVNDIQFTPNGTALVGTEDGLWSSADDGWTWSRRVLPAGTSADVRKIALSPRSDREIWIGLGDSGGTARPLVLRSLDGGFTWRDVTPPLASATAAEAISFNRGFPGYVHVGFDSGEIWATTNGGTSWSDRSAGLPKAPVLDIVQNGTRLLVTGGSVDGSRDFGLFQSGDGGVSWSAVQTANWPVKRASDIEVDPTNPSVIVLATLGGGIYRSTDGGLSWTFGVDGTAGMTVRSVRFTPGSSSRLLAGVDSFAILASADGGATFTPSAAGIRELHIVSTSVNPLDPGEVAVAFAAPNWGGIYTTRDGGQTWGLEPVRPTAWHAVQYAPDGRLYAAGAGGLYRRDGGVWTLLGPTADANIQVVRFSPTRPDVLFAGGSTGSALDNKSSIWRSTDGGATWASVYVGTDQHEDVVDIEFLPNGNGRVVLASVIDFYGPNATKGGVLRSTDGGDSWSAANSGLTTGVEAYAIATSAADPGTVYLADGDPRGVGFGGLYRSTDGGQTWARTAPVGPVREVFADPDDARIVYIGQTTTDKVRRSEDGGITFVPFDQGMDGAGFATALFSPDRTAIGLPRLLASTWLGVFATNLYSTRPRGHDVTVEEGEERSGLDFGAKALPGEVRGVAYEDANGDGSRNPGEAGLAGWTVFLDANGNGTLDVGETSTVTDSDGRYRFTGLDPGDYVVVENLQSGWKRTQPQGGSYTVPLGPGDAADGKDFGVQSLPGDLSGALWNDKDGDGVRDDGEAPLAGWTVYLDQNANGTLDAGERSTVTNSQGGYAFTDLRPGTYLISELLPSFWRQTFPGIGYSERFGGGPPAGTPHHAWKDHDPSTPGVIDIWYDFRAQSGFTNRITAGQKSLVQTALAMWADATKGRIKFIQNTSAPAEDIINIGTGDLAALGGTSAPGGVLALGGAVYSDDGSYSLSSGVAWMDMAEKWDEVIGNGDPPGTYDYFTIASHEIGHALGLDHIEGLPWGNIMDEEYTGEKTHLSAIDRDRIRAIYGSGSDAAGGFHLAGVGRGESVTGLDFGNQHVAPAVIKALALDFGTAESPVAAGYTRATADDGYAISRGFGWLDGVRFSVDRGTQSALNRDFVATQKSAFVVDVLNGTYRVTVTLGDARAAHDRMGVFLEGNKVASLSTAARQFVTRSFQVKVADRQLTLTLQDLGGRDQYVVLSALKVVPLVVPRIASVPLGVVTKSNSPSEVSALTTGTFRLSRASDADAAGANLTPTFAGLRIEPMVIAGELTTSLLAFAESANVPASAFGWTVEGDPFQDPLAKQFPSI